MKMEFVEGKITEEKIFGGVVFPKTLNPPTYLPDGCYSYGANELAEMVKEKQEWLSQLLRRHSAILLRGFQLSSPEDFRRVVEAFGWDEMPYMGATSRAKVADGVLTANDAPLHQLINFHHEMALMKEFPSKILFFCAQPSPEGGETSILGSPIIVEKLEERVPEFVSKITESGLIFKISTPRDNASDNTVISKTWKWLLKTEDEDEAEKRAKEKINCNAVNFNEDGSAEFVFGPMNPIREFGGRRVWFNTILGYTSNEEDSNVCFGDGTKFPQTVIDAYKKIIQENCVDIKWEKGDVLLLDNLCVQHARRPGISPRVILVSIRK